MLLYMQPKHNYKIKHHGHFKIKAHYLLERGFSVILHSSHCLLLWSCVVIHCSSRGRSATKAGPAKDLRKSEGSGGGRESTRKTKFCAGKENYQGSDCWWMAAAHLNLPLCTFFIADAPPSPLLYCIHPEKHVLRSCSHRSFYTRHSSSFMGQKNLTNPTGVRG